MSQQDDDRNHLACPKCKSTDLDFKRLCNNMRAPGEEGGAEPDTDVVSETFRSDQFKPGFADTRNDDGRIAITSPPQGTARLSRTRRWPVPLLRRRNRKAFGGPQPVCPGNHQSAPSRCP